MVSTFQGGSKSLKIDVSLSQYASIDLTSVANHLCMTNPTADNCPDGFTLNVYLRVLTAVDKKGFISTRSNSGGFRTGFRVAGSGTSMIK